MNGKSVSHKTILRLKSRFSCTAYSPQSHQSICQGIEASVLSRTHIKTISNIYLWEYVLTMDKNNGLTCSV